VHQTTFQPAVNVALAVSDHRIYFHERWTVPTSAPRLSGFALAVKVLSKPRIISQRFIVLQLIV
jgi:hypothetical protein